jgi:predicted nucleic acid-binding protein
MSKSFIDSNIWIYALIESKEEEAKRDKIIAFLEELKNKSRILISVQVLNEFHWILKRKYNIDEIEIREKVTNGILKIVSVVPLDLKNYKTAYKIRDNYSFSYWDSLIIASALEKGCDTLYSEDMQHNLVIENKLTIKNPLI